jgi:GDP-4-dehydro-6-deoxy-D-mannose reductase
MAKGVKNYLITGFSGFVSRYFFEYLHQIQEKANIFGVDIAEPSFDFKCYSNINTKFSKVDLLDKNKVREIMLRSQPDFILHLASFSSVALSWQKPVLSFNNNTNIFLTLLEAVRETGIKCKVLSVGSSEEYGIVKNEDVPLSESVQLNPISPYAVARVSQELLSKIYIDGYGLNIIMTRSFNHIGPWQKEVFAVSSFAKQMVKIKKENRNKGVLRVGNFDIVRDFLDVRDVVKAYYLLLQKGKRGEIYNVCAGRGIALKELINCIADYLRIKVELKVDQSLIRPNDNPVIIGNNKKIRDELGWHPEIPLKKSIADICDHWEQNSAMIRND